MSDPITTTQACYEVWQRLCEGVPQAVIARQLKVPVLSVGDRVRRLRRQAGVSSTIELLKLEFVVNAPIPRCFPLLTPRQGQVALLVADGLPHRAIAEALGISAQTVKAHMQGIYDAIGMSNKVELALWVMHQQKESA